MKAKLAKTLLPTLLGIAAVLGILAIFNLLVYSRINFTNADKKFFTQFVPIAAICALSIQLFLTLPFWKKFKTQGKVWGLHLVPFTIFLCIGSGVAFGFTFWERSFGMSEFFAVTLTGIVAFAIYWTVNIITLKRLDR